MWQQLGAGDLAVFGDDGYTKLPSGLIIQWGSKAVSGAAVTTVPLPMCFPIRLFSATASLEIAGYAGNASERYISGSSNCSITFTTYNNIGRVAYMAIGY
ncbi:gp53-like domain-containing protein [Pseudomonas aeruginosa]|uniref:gp53-like domain-containing protein n=1 Tax=Pseudomonas aeruginosa TaxID=287 RepID=UPI003B3BAA70